MLRVFGDAAPARPAVPGWQIEGIAGQGGFGIVWRASRENDGVAGAIKVAPVADPTTVQEGVRKLCAAALYGMVGLGIWVFRATPALVDTLFDVSILRQPAQTIPAVGGLPIWNPATRTLTLAEMPAGATRQEVWREGPGGAPELLIIGARGELSVQIPANITFDVGDLYQLWMQSRNSKGSSAPGPKVSWTGV